MITPQKLLNILDFYYRDDVEACIAVLSRRISGYEKRHDAKGRMTAAALISAREILLTRHVVGRSPPTVSLLPS